MRHGMVVVFLVLFASSLYGQSPPAGPTPDAAALKAQIDALRAEYEKQLKELQKQLEDVKTKVLQLSPQPESSDAQAPAQSADGPAAALPLTVTPPAQDAAPLLQQPAPLPTQGVQGSQVSGANVFNPAIAVIGDFLGAAGINKVNPNPAMEMHESEASFQAIVDPYARADFFFSFGEEGVALEEGYITFPAIPGGLLVKVGKFRAAFGKVNTLHNHVLPWTDRPLVNVNLVAGEDGIDDAGVSVARLIPVPKIFLEATGQIFRGDSDELFRSNKRGELSYVGHLRGYQDITNNSNLDLGASFAYGHNDSGLVDGVDVGNFHTRLYGADLTYRWKPLQRAIYHSFVGRSEFVWSLRQQPGGTQSATGYYVSGDYQFARRWFVGGRYDYSKLADEASLKDTGQSAVLTYYPSEFSQLRAQYRRINYGVGSIANELLFQVQFAIGAHGAHPF